MKVVGVRPSVMFVVYDHPTDYPKHFVVRRWAIVAGGLIPGECRLADDLDDARALVPSGMHRIVRSHHDDPKIVEAWI